VGGLETEGLELGASEGIELGSSLGIVLGSSDGLIVGSELGEMLGASEGIELGSSLGIVLGSSDGLILGWDVTVGWDVPKGAAATPSCRTLPLAAIKTKRYHSCSLMMRLVTNDVDLIIFHYFITRHVESTFGFVRSDARGGG